MLVFLTTHDMKLVERVADRVIVIKEGSIIADDKLENLKKLFRAISYRISFSSDVTVELMDELRRCKGIMEVSRVESSRIDVTLDDLNSLHHLFEFEHFLLYQFVLLKLARPLSKIP